MDQDDRVALVDNHSYRASQRLRDEADSCDTTVILLEGQTQHEAWGPGEQRAGWPVGRGG